MDVVKQETNNGTPVREEQRTATPRREERHVMAPAVDVAEGEEGFLVVADLPGVAPEDLSVRLEKGEIVVQGRRGDVGRGPGVEYRRVIGLPPEVDGDAVSATFARGVLELRLPRKSSAKPRQIPIQSA